MLYLTDVIINLILILGILFVLFDTIKRTKGALNKGSKLFFLAFLLVLGEEITRLLERSNFLTMMNEEFFEMIFYVILILSIWNVYIKIREVNNNLKNHYKKRKHKKSS